MPVYRPLAVTSQLQLLSAMLEGKVKVWNTEMSTNVKRASRKGLLPDYYSILAIIFNIIHVFFSRTFSVLFCFPSNMAAKYVVRHVWRHAKVVYITPYYLYPPGPRRGQGRGGDLTRPPPPPNLLGAPYLRNSLKLGKAPSGINCLEIFIFNAFEYCPPFIVLLFQNTEVIKAADIILSGPANWGYVT